MNIKDNKLIACIIDFLLLAFIIKFNSVNSQGMDGKKHFYVFY